VERLSFFAFLSSGEGADMLPPVALRLPGLRTLRVLLPGPVHHITTVSAPQYYCLCNQASLPPPDTVN
ncbi:hypothetical protein N5I82_27470, partial [Klebsiella quasipneumoniae]|uniref:hypothetical protein n=2 Tax=Klebsiella quasipneumoniae TaxID=1463165 RepID=UPI001D0CF0C9